MTQEANMKVLFYPLEQIPDEKLAYAVVAPRKNGQWLFCRHQNRTTWEIPGGHREAGESVLDCAQRELYEETGATGELEALTIYAVETDSSVTYGMLYLANVTQEEDIPPHSEMGEKRWASLLPENLTYPLIQPYLYNYVQGQLNIRTSPDEWWDILDENRQPTGRKMRRRDPFQPGDYHLVVDVWMRRPDGKFLLTKRAPNKGYPLMWECTGGSAVSGDDSLTAALREAQEETGMVLDPQKGRIILQYKTQDSFKDVWLFEHDAAPEDVILQEGETVDARLATKEDLITLFHQGILVPFPYFEQLLPLI